MSLSRSLSSIMLSSPRFIIWQKSSRFFGMILFQPFNFCM
ncbi:MAG: hypothetical protein IJN74_01020 [Clostridia bacterium]|nr:hypothetical protein [Clostridia bacterium]